MMMSFLPNIHVAFKGRIAEKKRIEKYVKSVLHYLYPRMKRNITVDIHISNVLEDYAYGYCLGDRQGVTIELGRIDPLTGSRLDMSKMMLTLAHELVHAKQFLKGELSPQMKNWKTIPHEGIPYSRQPWEREAYKKEEFLHHMFWEV